MTNPRPFAVFDIDGTIIRWQLYHAIVHQLSNHGLLPSQSVQQIHQAQLTWQKRSNNHSFQDYQKTLVDTYHQALTSIEVSAFNQAVDDAFNTYKDQVYTYTRDLIFQLKDQGYLLFAISGSHQEIVQKLGDYYHFDQVEGSQYQVQDHKFTGYITEEPYQRKGQVLQKLVEQHQATWENSIAIGDTPSDIPMLQLVQFPIAFNPDQALYQSATQNNWPIVIERKNVIYQLKSHHGSYQLTTEPLLPLK